jgi:hypothetical protein
VAGNLIIAGSYCCNYGFVTAVVRIVESRDSAKFDTALVVLYV